MNIGFYTCLTVGGIFLLLAIVFAILKGKAAMLISGFNTMPKEKRELYNKEKMVDDQRNTFLLWTVIMAVGAILSYFISSFSSYIAIAAFLVWLILFFKDIHLDEENAFAKYKIK